MTPRHLKTADRLRVLSLVAYPGTFGGGERLASDIARRLDPERFESAVCVSRWPAAGSREDALASEWAEAMREGGVEVILMKRRRRTDIGAWRPLVSRLAGRRIDVLHTHLFGSNLTGTVLGRALRTPVVVAHEHSWAFTKGPRTFLDRHLISRFADAYIAVSQEDRRKMIELEQIDPGRITVVPNGIPAIEGALDRSAARRELGLRDTDFAIGTVGIIRPEKAFDVLVLALERLRDRLPEARVVIAGPDSATPAPGELRALIARADLEDRVDLLGPRPDIRRLMPGLDLAVCSSDREGSPLTVMEYMAAGLPVVSTRVGGVPEVVVEGETGLMVPPGDPDALAAAILGLAVDAPARERMGSAGRLRQARLFSIDAVVRRFEEIYSTAYAARRGGVTGSGRAASASTSS